MTFAAKTILATASALLFIDIEPSVNNSNYIQTSHKVDRLIFITEKDIVELEARVDSIIMEKNYELTQFQIANDTTETH